MNMEKILGLLYIILGLLLVIFPIFSSALISLAIGFAMVCFGISAIFNGIIFSEAPIYSYLSLSIGVIALLFGLIFMFFLNALPFLISLQFYIVGFILVVYGILGAIYLKDKKLTIISIIGIILGIITIALAVFAASQPVLIAILIGVLLIIEGVALFVVGKSLTLIETYG